jgi:hypothetical protein
MRGRFAAPSRRARASSRAIGVALLVAASTLLATTAGASDPLAPSDGARSLGAAPAGPMLPSLSPVRLDARIDNGYAGSPGTRVAVPLGLDTRAPSAALDQQAIPYRVEPRDAAGRKLSAFDLPPEIPNDAEFERVDTFDQLANPHYEIREEIWNTPESLVMGDGISRYGGIGYVPFWARNTIRLGRFSIFPFLHDEAAWHSSLGGYGSAGKETFEVTSSAGVLTEYLAEAGRTKFKASARADYHWYDDAFTDAFTYVGGIGVEQRFKRFYTVDAGIEFERAQIPDDLNTSLASGDNRIERVSVYADGRWDRFLTDDMRLEAGGTYAWVDDLSSTGRNGGDYRELNLYGRLNYAIMRHESFAYAEYRYANRDADGVSSDLDAAHEVRLGVNGILPHGRVRRLVGNAYVGYRSEEYNASNLGGSVGRGRDESVSLLTFGGDLTYKPSAYTSANLAYSHTNTYSAVSNFNLVDTITLGITQNLSHRLLGRVAASWSRIEPQGFTDSQRLTLGTGLRWVVSDNFDVTADYEYSHRFRGAGLDEGDAHRAAVGATLYVR